MKNLFTYAAAALALFLGHSAAGNAQVKATYDVVPKPVEVSTTGEAPFRLDISTRIVCGKDAAAQRNAQFLQQYLYERTGFRPAIVKKSAKSLRKVLKAPAAQLPGSIVLHSDAAATDHAEGYVMHVEPQQVRIIGGSAAGTFYGIQTLRKSMPHSLLNLTNPRVDKTDRYVEIPAAVVSDYPRFSYRGAHLDTSRHYVTPDSVRRFIDIMALHGLNRFHWHITDDQGWRLEIKKYPRLTEVGSRRSQTVIGHNSGKYDGQPYGGYYTQQECRDLVAYAAERNITIVPEIDMPGHMLGALAAYPELGCTGGPYDVWTIWGVSEDVLCAGNDKTLQFIDDVLDEVAAIFPSEYIHVGGDECPKTAWKSCPKCQARIKAEGLEAKDGHSAEERLQSYVIRHAEAHLSKLGRKMIGWDETLEGGLADGATVMSWRGEEGGIEAARQHHDVIMTPNTYLYFDYYQSLLTETEPDAIGGYLPLERVYGYEPVSDAMLADGLAPYIVGVQANTWTEYMPTFRQIEYMTLPRMAALAEIQWTPRGRKDYAAFCKRALNLMGLYDEQGYNYARHIYDVQATYGVDTEQRAITIDLHTPMESEIRYTLDSTEPMQNGRSKVYEGGTIALQQDAQFRAAAFWPAEARPGSSQRRWARSNITQADFTFHKATACNVTLANDPAPRYTFAGAQTLVDGVQAQSTNFQTGQWLGFNGKDLDATIDLGADTEVSQLRVNTCVGKPDWIFNCRGLRISASSDGKDFVEIGRADYPADGQDTPNGIRTLTLDFPATTARYFRVQALCEQTIPEWHNGRGLPAFLFVDEIVLK